MGRIYHETTVAKDQADGVESRYLNDIRGNADRASWHQLTPIAVDGATGIVNVGFIPVGEGAVEEVLKDEFGAPVSFDLENPATATIRKLFVAAFVYTPVGVVGEYRIAMSGGE